MAEMGLYGEKDGGDIWPGSTPVGLLVAHRDTAGGQHITPEHNTYTAAEDTEPEAAQHRGD